MSSVQLTMHYVNWRDARTRGRTSSSWLTNVRCDTLKMWDVTHERCEVWHTKDVRCDTQKMWDVTHERCEVRHTKDVRCDTRKMWGVTHKRCEMWHTKDVGCDTRKMWGVSHERCEVWHTKDVRCDTRKMWGVTQAVLSSCQHLQLYGGASGRHCSVKCQVHWLPLCVKSCGMSSVRCQVAQVHLQVLWNLKCVDKASDTQIYS